MFDFPDCIKSGLFNILPNTIYATFVAGQMNVLTHQLTVYKCSKGVILKLLLTLREWQKSQIGQNKSQFNSSASHSLLYLNSFTLKYSSFSAVLIVSNSQMLLLIQKQTYYTDNTICLLQAIFVSLQALLNRIDITIRRLSFYLKSNSSSLFCQWHRLYSPFHLQQSETSYASCNV